MVQFNSFEAVVLNIIIVRVIKDMRVIIMDKNGNSNIQVHTYISKPICLSFFMQVTVLKLK